eukprot:c14075_g1_i1 orf=202-1773(+)
MERSRVAEIVHNAPVLLLLLAFTIFISHSAVVSRSLDPDPGARDFAAELDATSFNSSLWAAPARWAILEFYAHWCPACRNYKPQYEKVARLFNGPDAAHPGIVFMAKVDCALKINAPLCDRFKIAHYPTLLWAPPSSFTWASDEHASWEAIENGRKAESLLQFINNKIGETFTLDDAITYENNLVKGDELDFGQVAISNFDIEEATAKAMDIILIEKLLNQKTRSSFIQFLQLLVVHHPSRNCRKGTADLLMNLEDLWPPFLRQGDEKLKEADTDGVIQEPDFKALENFHVCGDHIPRGYWMFCRGSRNDTRGYSCGLWLLFHAVSVRVDDRLASSTFRTICSFIDHFFTCKECREHFLEFCSSAKTKVSSRRQLVLWLWNVHNEVNDRVGKEEASLGTGDSKFVKQVWPPLTLCKACRKDGDVKRAEGTPQDIFNFSEVYSFLLTFYGHALAPSRNMTFINIPAKQGGGLLKVQESTSRSAVTVPVGAALAIAFASCGFGAVACYWRTRQKKRKYGGVFNKS